MSDINVNKNMYFFYVGTKASIVNLAVIVSFFQPTLWIEIC